MDEFDLYEQKLNLIFDSRGGLEDYHDRDWAIYLLAGALIGNRKDNNLSTEEVCNFLDIVLNHNFNFVYNKTVKFNDCLSKKIQQHPVFTDKLGKFLLQFKLVNVQLGPGEFFITFFDTSTTIGIGPGLDYDIRREINGKKERIENKSAATNYIKIEQVEKIKKERDSILVAKVPNDQNSKTNFSRSEYRMCKVENIDEQFNYDGEGLRFKNGKKIN